MSYKLDIVVLLVTDPPLATRLKNNPLGLVLFLHKLLGLHWKLVPCGTVGSSDGGADEGTDQGTGGLYWIGYIFHCRLQFIQLNC